MASNTPTITAIDLDEGTVSVATYGSGRPILLLHGGAGPQSMVPFAELLSSRADVNVALPTHPGFGGTPRPNVSAAFRASPPSTATCSTIST